MDDRHDLYGADFLKDYLRAMRLTPDWEQVLGREEGKLGAGAGRIALANMLKETSEWNVVYRDGTAVLFSRRTAASRTIVGVDIKSEDGVDLDGFVSPQHRAKLPAIQGGQNFAGHDRRGWFEHLWPA